MKHAMGSDGIIIFHPSPDQHLCYISNLASIFNFTLFSIQLQLFVRNFQDFFTVSPVLDRTSSFRIIQGSGAKIFPHIN
jgi:hypothetical protein